MLKPTGRILLILLSLSLSYSLALGAPPSTGSEIKSELVLDQKQQQKQPKDLFGLINGIIANNVRKCLAGLTDSTKQASDRYAAQVKATVDAIKQLVDQELQRCDSLEDPPNSISPSSAQLCVVESQEQGPLQAVLLANQQSVEYLTRKLGTTLWTELTACLAPLQLPTLALQKIFDNSKLSRRDAAELSKLTEVQGDTGTEKALKTNLGDCVRILYDILAKFIKEYEKLFDSIASILPEIVSITSECGRNNPFTFVLCVAQNVANVLRKYPEFTSALVEVVKNSVLIAINGNEEYFACLDDLK